MYYIILSPSSSLTLKKVKNNVVRLCLLHTEKYICFKKTMNRVQSEKFRDVHLNHKYNLIHMLPSTEVPALSGFYLKSFYNGTKRYRLRLPESIVEPDNKFCGNCGAVRIPLFNTDMSITESNIENSGESIRALQYTCLHCKTQAQLAPTRIQKEIPERDEQRVKFKKEEQKKDKVNKKTSARERAKKRKRSTLSNMLSQKNEEKKNKSFSLSLDSIIQND